jgi:hypothetical protein
MRKHTARERKEDTLLRHNGQVNEQHRALFCRAGSADMAIAVDTRPKHFRDRTRYSRKGRASNGRHGWDA